MGGYGYNCDTGGDMSGADGGAGGSGFGAALFAGGSANVMNSTFAWNTTAGGAGGAGGPGGYCEHGTGGPHGAWASGGSGLGAIYGGVHLINCTVAFNSATGGSASGGITGGWLINTLLATNLPVNNRNAIVTDAGHNLSSDGSCAFTGVGSMNNTDPKLGPLANNGGPTLTMALLPGSPAIDAGDNTLAPPTDQRGFPRPAGLACDIGAYEYPPPIIARPPPTQTAEIGSATCFSTCASDYPPPTYQWFFNGIVLAGSTNSALCLSGIQTSNVGAYTVVVSGADGSVTSSPAMLNVITPVEMLMMSIPDCVQPALRSGIIALEPSGVMAI